MSNSDPAADFLREAQLRDPTRYAEVAARYPTSTEYDDFRAANGEPRSRTLKRRGPAGGVPRHMRRPMTDEERALRREWLREYALDYALAKELADQGM